MPLVETRLNYSALLYQHTVYTTLKNNKKLILTLELSYQVNFLKLTIIYHIFLRYGLRDWGIVKFLNSCVMYLSYFYS